MAGVAGIAHAEKITRGGCRSIAAARKSVARRGARRDFSVAGLLLVAGGVAEIILAACKSSCFRRGFGVKGFMQFFKISLLIGALALGGTGLVRAEDTPAQAAARAALEAKLKELDSQPAAAQPVAAPIAPAAPVVVAPVAAPRIIVTAKGVTKAPTENGDNPAQAAARAALAAKYKEFEKQSQLTPAVAKQTKAEQAAEKLKAKQAAEQAKAELKAKKQAEQQAVAQAEAERKAKKEAEKKAVLAKAAAEEKAKQELKLQAEAKQKALAEEKKRAAELAKAELKAKKDAAAKAQQELKLQAEAKAVQQAQQKKIATEQAAAVAKAKQEAAQAAALLKKQQMAQQKRAAERAAAEAKAKQAADKQAAVEKAKLLPPEVKNYPGKELGLQPIPAPPSPLGASKAEQLQSLLIKYKADQLTPEEYHRQRAEILGAP